MRWRNSRESADQRPVTTSTARSHLRKKRPPGQAPATANTIESTTILSSARCLRKRAKLSQMVVQARSADASTPERRGSPLFIQFPQSPSYRHGTFFGDP